MFRTIMVTGAIAAALAPVVAAAAQQRGGVEHRIDRRERPAPDRSRAERLPPCRDGDGGTLIGAIAGGLLGHSGAGRRDQIAGRTIDRSGDRGCRR